MPGSFWMHIQLQNCDNYLTFTPGGRLSIIAYMGRLCLKVGMWKEYFFSTKCIQNCTFSVKWYIKGYGLPIKNFFEYPPNRPLHINMLLTSQIIQHEQFDLHCFNDWISCNIIVLAMFLLSKSFSLFSAQKLLIGRAAADLWCFIRMTLQDTKQETNWLYYGA